LSTNVPGGGAVVVVGLVVVAVNVKYTIITITGKVGLHTHTALPENECICTNFTHML
jgi:hypothetical protein